MMAIRVGVCEVIKRHCIPIEKAYKWRLFCIFEDGRRLTLSCPPTAAPNLTVPRYVKAFRRRPVAHLLYVSVRLVVIVWRRSFIKSIFLQLLMLDIPTRLVSSGLHCSWDSLFGLP